MVLLNTRGENQGKGIDMGKIVFKTLRENVADEIRMKILNQELAPGMRIIEQSLSEELGVSRAPIREALRQLEQEGVVEYERNVGCSVKKITLEDIYEIYLLRSTYEVIAVKSFEGNFTDEDLAKMEAILEMMKDLEEGNVREGVNCDNMFHRVILERTELTRVLKAWTELNYGNLICFYMGNSDKKKIVERQYTIHKSLLDICITRDEKAICEAISEHYMKTVRRLMQEQKMDEQGFKFRIK